MKEHNMNFIALSETGMSEFMPSFLKNLSVGMDFLWHTIAPKGRSGGMFDIGAIDEGDFYIKSHLCNKSYSFKWALVAVYGPTQDEHKDKFLAELVHLCSHENLPIIIGCDFNVMRSSEEKNNDRFQSHWPFLFNAIIDGLNLWELDISGRKYTWANNLPLPTFEKLDRVLVTTEWEEKFPLTTVQALPRVILDHTPLLLNSDKTSTSDNETSFKFEYGWLRRDGFVEMIREIWSSHTEGNTPIERWQGKIRRIRQYLRGWAKNTSGQYKKEKKHILNTLDTLDKKQRALR
jgi:hypothetical protein